MSTYVITGAASGIGAATRSCLEADGHRVIGIDLHDTDIKVDVGTPEGCANAIANVCALVDGRIDGFAAIAGIAPSAGRSGRQLIAVNYFGAIEMLEGLSPLLAEGDNPSAVLISSNSTTSQPDWPMNLAEACLAGDQEAANAIADSFGDQATIQAYPATKAAIAYYARTKSAEYIKAGIRLNAVAPGFVDTPMTQEGMKDPLTAKAIEQFLATVPAGRGGRPEEVASFIAYLLGPESTYFVGSVVFVDGGTDAACRGKDWPTMWQTG
ncbi:SDR family oxidoreductase [Nocardia cyriacigeorgica]|uniref:SDR family oxidoreductase n=1 Tax=Nocardia cyriacigeorgica TaxID=135487 RepID=A0A6P1D0Z1_9NOCA|nr:SDR family oxidoreductase [Nocardia cyriacigeorgica]NEW43239.1 SDR family oxidoreductase [Nocardia cyriacigeorgica]